MNRKSLISTFTMAALAAIAVAVPAHAQGWGNGSIPPGIAKKLYGYAGNNGLGSSFFGNTGFGNNLGYGGYGGGCNQGYGGGCNHGYGGGNYSNGFGGGMFGGHHHHHGMNNSNWYGNNNNWNNWQNAGWNNGGTFGNNNAWLTGQLSSRQQALQNMLNSGNLSPWQQAKIQNQLSQIQNAQNSIANGTFNYGAFGGLRRLLGI